MLPKILLITGYYTSEPIGQCSRDPAGAVKRIARGRIEVLENVDCAGGQKRDNQKRQQ
jgi:hypothetical protein